MCVRVRVRVCVCVCMRALTVLGEEVAVDDVDQTLQLLFHQPALRNLLDELREQLTAETRAGRKHWRLDTSTSP